jgi:multicomponent Na+:H+ antiporter subunit F
VITFLNGLGVLVALLIAANFIRVFVGPSIYDRLLGVGAIGTNAVILLALLAFIYDRPDGFLDLAITYAILNFIGVVAVAKYLTVSKGHQLAEDDAVSDAAIPPGSGGEGRP